MESGCSNVRGGQPTYLDESARLADLRALSAWPVGSLRAKEADLTRMSPPASNEIGPAPDDFRPLQPAVLRSVTVWSARLQTSITSPSAAAIRAECTSPVRCKSIES